jgi:hypothetical protein
MDPDLGISYHPVKANVIADALSQRSHVNHLVVKSIPSELCDKFVLPLKKHRFHAPTC